MKCPCCNEELVLDIKREYETSAEHIMCSEHYPLRDSYICKSENCFMNGIGFWGFDGSFYLTESMNLSDEVNSHVKDGLTAALGSFERKIEAESAWRSYNHYYRGKNYKKDTILRIGKHRWSKEWNVTANEDGDILKKSWKLCHSYNGVVYTSNFKMLKYSISRFFKEKSWKSSESIIKDAKFRIGRNWIIDRDFPWYYGRFQWYRILYYWFVVIYFKIFNKSE